jgi:hypothetical protein
MRASSLILICILSGLLTESAAQISRESELFVILKVNDSLLFNAAFDTCDPGVLEQLFTEDFEFFHDKGGVTRTRFLFRHSAYRLSRNVATQKGMNPAARVNRRAAI